jgi:hypothetical protein
MHHNFLAPYGAWAATWGDGLWRASWKGGLFILAVALLCRLVPRLPPAARCWLWWLACLKLLVGWIGVELLTLPVLPERLQASSTIQLARVDAPSPPAPLPMLGEGRRPRQPSEGAGG